jgi:predicted phosphodiesterase
MRIGIITDIHENVRMLEKALELATYQKCDELVCLGDITGFDRRFYRYNYTRSASGCIKLIRENFKWIVAGNHDLFSAGRIPSWSDGFQFPDDWFRMDPSGRKLKASGKVWCYEGDAEKDLKGEEIDFLRSLPEFIVTDTPGITCLFSHYIFPDLTGSTTRYAERGKHLTGHWKFMDNNEVLYSFSGHTHNHFTGFAYRRTGYLFNAFQNLPNDSFFLGKEKTIMTLPPLSGEKGRTGFSIFDSDLKKLSVFHLISPD